MIIINDNVITAIFIYFSKKMSQKAVNSIELKNRNISGVLISLVALRVYCSAPTAKQRLHYTYIRYIHNLDEILNITFLGLFSRARRSANIFFLTFPLFSLRNIICSMNQNMKKVFDFLLWLFSWNFFHQVYAFCNVCLTNFVLANLIWSQIAVNVLF